MEEISKRFTAWKVSVFGVFLVRIPSECRKIWTRKTKNTDTFHAVLFFLYIYIRFYVLSFHSIHLDFFMNLTYLNKKDTYHSPPVQSNLPSHLLISFWLISKPPAYSEPKSICRYPTTQKMKFSIKDFFSKCDQILRKFQSSTCSTCNFYIGWPSMRFIDIWELAFNYILFLDFMLRAINLSHKCSI